MQVLWVTSTPVGCAWCAIFNILGGMLLSPQLPVAMGTLHGRAVSHRGLICLAVSLALWGSLVINICCS